MKTFHILHAESPLPSLTLSVNRFPVSQSSFPSPPKSLHPPPPPPPSDIISPLSASRSILLPHPPKIKQNKKKKKKDLIFDYLSWSFPNFPHPYPSLSLYIYTPPPQISPSPSSFLSLRLPGVETDGQSVEQAQAAAAAAATPDPSLPSPPSGPLLSTHVASRRVLRRPPAPAPPNPRPAVPFPQDRPRPNPFPPSPRRRPGPPQPPPAPDHGAYVYCPGGGRGVEPDGGGGADDMCLALRKDSELSSCSSSRWNFGIWSPELRHPGGERRRLLGSCPDGREFSVAGAGAEAEALRPAFNAYGQVCLNSDGSSDCYADRISQVSQSTNLSQQNGLFNDYSRLCSGVVDNGFRVSGLVSRSSLNGRRAQFAQVLLNCTSIEAMRGRIESIATDPEGFRVLLSMMERMDRDEAELVFSETIERVGYLMTDPFANHVVQRLLEVCSEEQRKQILYAVTWNSQIVSICLSTYGIRSIQKLMDTLTTRWQKNVVIHALAPFMYQLIKNAIGHHVIRHCLKVFSNEDNEILYDLVATKCYEIATDKSGCCILQQCVEHAQGKQRDRLVTEITTHALLLAENCYGNYVVQHLLTLEIPQVADDLHRQFLGNYAILSCNKYGSNVVEKCLKEMGYNQFKQIVVELLEEFLTVLLNEYGNYVIRRAVEVSKEQRQTQIYYILSAELRRYDPLIKSNPYGKKAVSRLEKQNILP